MLTSTDVLITGGAGFIGANLARTLTMRGARSVTVLDDLSTGFLSNLDGLTDVRFVEGSILDRNLLAEVMPGGGSVVHLAARPSVPRSVKDPIASHEANATGTLYVLEEARNADVQQVILASSSSVYGDNDAPAKHEELPTAPKSPYGVSKLATEAYALAYQRTYGLGTLPLRFFNVFGPLQAAGHAYAAVVPAFVDLALRNESLIVHGDGGQSRDFTFVGTVCQTIAAAIDRNVTYDGPVNLAFGSRYTLMDLVGIIGEHLGVELTTEHIETRAGDIRHSKADPTRLLSLFPEIEPVSLADGVKATIEWFQESEAAQAT